jgi:hypothetical protein
VAEFLALSHGTSYLGYSARSSKGAFHPFFTGPGGGAPPSPRTALGRAGSGAFGSGGGSPRVPPPHRYGAPGPPASPHLRGAGGGLGRQGSGSMGLPPPGSPRVGGAGAAAAAAAGAGAMLPPGCRSADPDAADEEQQRRRESESGGGSGGGGGGGGGGPAGEGDVSVPLITCGRDSSLYDVSQGVAEGGQNKPPNRVATVPNATAGLGSASSGPFPTPPTAAAAQPPPPTPPPPTPQPQSLKPPKVIKLMIDAKVHRVYVMDADCKPSVVGVVTPTDILRTLCDRGLGAAPGGPGEAAGAGGDALMPQAARPGGAGAAKKARLEEAAA